jgi:hypothetical protein
MKLHFGRLQVELPPETVIQYDGEVMLYKGKEYHYPELRSSIKAKWLLPVGSTEKVSNAPVPAGVKVRPASDPTKGREALPMVAHEEQHVGTVRNKATVSAEKIKSFSATLVKEEEGDHRAVGPSVRASKASEDTGGGEMGRPVGKVLSPTNLRIDVGQDAGGDADAVVAQTVASKAPERPRTSGGDIRSVGKIASPSTHRATVSDSSSTDREIRKFDATPKTSLLIPEKGRGGVVAASGDEVEEILAVLDPESRAQKMARERKEAVARSEAKASPQTSASDGVQPSEVQEAKGGDLEPPPEVKVISPKTFEEAVVRGDDVEIAPGIFWNKKLHWRTRAKIAIDQYRSNPKVLALIKAYEEKSVSKLIDEHLVRLSAKETGSSTQAP